MPGRPAETAMGRRAVVALLVTLLIAGAPLGSPSAGTAEAQDAGCSCYASFDAVDSDLEFVDWYFNYAMLPVPAAECADACDAWRRDWFYGHACDVPIRINRGRQAWWGYYNGLTDNHIGPDTWWCPFPPP